MRSALLDDWNPRLFLALDAAAGAAPAVVAPAEAVAAWSVIPVLAAVAASWVQRPPRRRGALLAVAAVVPIALALNGIVGWFHHRPLPFPPDATGGSRRVRVFAHIRHRRDAAGSRG